MSNGSRSVHITDRSAARYRTGSSDGAILELELIDGSYWRIGLSEISESGLSFALDLCPAWLSPGATIEQTLISAGNLVSSGCLKIVHVRFTSASGTSCGAEFFPRTAADQRSLSQLIARLDEQGLRSS